jgi:nucleoside-diphosphate-sugar epimerase
MSILIIGGMGFIGSRVTHMLLSRGESVVVAARRPTLHRLGADGERITVVQGDKANFDQIIDWIKRFDVEKIIDVSAELEAESERAPFHSSRLNIMGTLNVFEAARLLDVKRVVWTSSYAIYGDKKKASGPPPNEEVLHDPVTVYGASKSYGEFMVKHYNKRWGLDVVAVRPSSIYGPLRAGGLTGWLSDIVKAPLEGKIVDIPVGRDETANFCFVDDCAEALVRSCLYDGDRLPNTIYNIGGFKATVGQLMEEVAKHIPKACARYGDNTLYYLGDVDISRIRRDLGFELRFDVAAGIEEQVRRQRSLLSQQH